jgi:hypothetical protein
MARITRSAFALSALLSFSAGAHADEPDRAEELFREGNRAFAASDFRTAYVAYREAWTLRRSFDIACNLGRTEAELMLSRDAAEHLDYCLRTFSVSSRSDMKDAYKRFRDLFTKVRAEVAALQIEASPPGTEITVDGARYGIAPLGRDVFVDPGQHRVVGRFAGFGDAQRIVQVDAGGTLSVNLTLTQAPAATATPAPPAPTPGASPAPPDPTPPHAKARTIVVASGAALTLAGMGVGLGFLLKAESAADRVDELNTTLQSSGTACSPTSSAASCRELRSEIDGEKRSRDIASAAFTAGAVASLATLGAWLLIPESRPDRTSGVRATPYFSAEQAGLSVSGAY